jgi:hypothetical protein
MNVIFHTITAIGVAVTLTDTEKIRPNTTISKTILTGLFAFTLALISHGVLDYIPHCYLINSKIDAIAGLTIIIVGTWLTKHSYKIIVGLSFLGSILPDLIDLSPGILNKYLGLNLDDTDKLFPWHQHNYSGSIYNHNCSISTLNHLLLIVTIIIILWVRQTNLRQMINTGNHKY